MGKYLSVPKTDKIIEDGEYENIKYGLASMQGWRADMEDEHIIEIDEINKTYIFGIFDGHSGFEISKFCKLKFIYFLKKNKNFKEGNIDNALRETFLEIDKFLFTEPGIRFIQDIKNNGSKSLAGCTAIVVVIYNDIIYSAGAGDSQCILYSGENILSMSIEHNPKNKIEEKRILLNGGFIENNRVLGKINLSRSIGDLDFKKNKNLPLKDQMITAYPDVFTKKIEIKDKFLVLGCDGIWEYLSPKKICTLIENNIKNNKIKLSKLCCYIMDKSLAPNLECKYGKDNMSMIIIKLIN